ncbi:MAG: glycosyltransferase, partial [Emcibacteraceae bacterium]|nr:glycosyltransferase [Emcibacteraceae bacterium]
QKSSVIQILKSVPRVLTSDTLEIILSDDCSEDRTFEIIQEMAATYKGPHAITVRRNSQNAGLAAHVNNVFLASTGEILLLAAGDDISLPNRTGLSVDYLERNPQATAVLLSADVIDDEGQIIGERLSGTGKGDKGSQTVHDLLAWKHVTFGATRAMRRQVFTRFGPLNESCPTEDTPLLLRSLICGKNVLSNHKAVLYRRHENNLSGTASLKKIDTEEIYQQYRDDLNTAAALHLIQEELAQRLHDWLNVDHTIRRLRLKLASNDMTKLRDTIFAIRHRAIAPREKMKFLMGYLASLKGMAFR